MNLKKLYTLCTNPGNLSIEGCCKKGVKSQHGGQLPCWYTYMLTYLLAGFTFILSGKNTFYFEFIVRTLKMAYCDRTHK